MNQNILSLLGSDALASEQFADTFRRSEYREPEKALLLAVLEDAIGCFLEYDSAQDPIGKERFQEAEEWIMQSAKDWFFSFENICELLGLNPEYLRQGLQRCRAKMTKQQKTPPRHRGMGRHAA